MIPLGDAAPVFGWLVQTSLQAGLLVLLILGIQALIGRRLAPRWHCLLWLVLVVRLVLPWAPASRLSVHNLLGPIASLASRTAPNPSGPAAEVGAEPAPTRAAQSPPSLEPEPPEDDGAAPTPRTPNVDQRKPEPAEAGSTAPALADATPEPDPAAQAAPTAPPTRAEATPDEEPAAPPAPIAATRTPAAQHSPAHWWPGWWITIWLVGALVMAAFLIRNQVLLWLAVKGRRPITDTAILDLLENCKARMGVQVLLAIVPTDRLHTPALYGLFRPRLLVPIALTERLSRAQLEHVLLHELAHLKRLDIHVGWLTAILQVVHWFNPLIWLAFTRWRTARELACDQAVLAVLGEAQRRDYAETILHLLECWTRPQRLPGMAGILEARSQLKRRITMIAHPPRMATGWSVAAAALSVGLVCVGLTNAQPSEPRRAVGSKAPVEARNAEATKEVVLRYDDDKPLGKKSLGASGHAISFQRPTEAPWVESVEIFASRYGAPEPPKESFRLYIMNDKQQVIADLPFAYSLIERGEQKWYTLRTPSIEVPEKFMIGLNFNPHQTKGIFLSYHGDIEKSHSFMGLPEEGYEPMEEKQDWMVRVHVAEKPSGEKGTRRLADWKPPQPAKALGGAIILPAKVALSQEKQSYGGSGPAIQFTLDAVQLGGTLPGNVEVRGFSVYASRYGSGYSTQATKVKVAVLDSANQVRLETEVPYALFTFRPAWVFIRLPKPIPLGQLTNDDHVLKIAFDPEAQQTKGIYFHYQKDPEQSHSFRGTVAQGFQPVNDREWLIRIHLQKTKAATTTRPAKDD